MATERRESDQANKRDGPASGHGTALRDWGAIKTIAMYDAYHDYVRCVTPADRLLDVNFSQSSREKWTRLVAFLSRHFKHRSFQMPDRPFPHVSFPQGKPTGLRRWSLRASNASQHPG